MKGKGSPWGEYVLVLGLAHILSQLPLSLVQALGSLTGKLFLGFNHRRRKIIFTNLKHIFPEKGEKELLRLARKTASHFGRITFDYLKMMGYSKEKLLAHLSIEGDVHLKKALSYGKGGFIYSGHFGHWELASQGLAAMGYPQAMVYRPLDNPKLDRWLQKIRRRFGNTLIPKKGAIRGMLQALKEKTLVDILMDQKYSQKGSLQINFLGKSAPTAPTLGYLIKKTGSPVVPLYSYPQGKGYRVVLHPPLSFSPDEPVERIVQTLSDHLSEQVLKTPYLWLWFHDRWKLVS